MPPRKNAGCAKEERERLRKPKTCTRAEAERQTPRPVDLPAAFAKSAEGQTSSAEKEAAQPLASLEAEAPQPQASLARVMVTQDAKMVDAILGTSVSSTSAAMTETAGATNQPGR